MKTKDFIRLRDSARELGWDITQESVPDKQGVLMATFARLESERRVRVEFSFDEEETKIHACWYNDRRIMWGQVRNLLENL